jgi:ketol-acid reductoisomerase
MSLKTKIPPTLYACHPELLNALKNGENLQKFCENWMKDESKFEERREWNRNHILKVERELNNSGEMSIEKALLF